MATARLNGREPTQEVPSDSSTSSNQTPLEQGEDDEPLPETTKMRSRAMNTTLASSNLQGPPVEPSWVDLQAQDDRVRTKLNIRIKKMLRARIPGLWFQNTSSAPKDKDVLLAAMRYSHSLRDRVSGVKRAPASLLETWPLGGIRGELQAIVPDILQKKARNNIEAQLKCTGSIQIMFAIGLYLDELEAAVSGLGEHSVRSSEPDELDEWSGIFDGDEGGENVGQQPHLKKELDERSDRAEGWHETSGGGGMEKEAVQSWERIGFSNSNGVKEGAVQRAEVDEVANQHGLSEPEKAEEDVLSAIQLPEEDWTGSIEEVLEQSKNIEAFNVALACAEGRRVYIGNLPTQLPRPTCRRFSQAMRLAKGPFLNYRGKRCSDLVLSLPMIIIADNWQRGKEGEAGAKARGDDALKAQGQGTAASEKARRVSEAQFENVLLEMEQWCDLWLSKRRGADQWHTFEDRLGLF